ncbi:MAG TPA: hypothetical protein VHE30_27635 [Polyangiaceae bacterium]|nr:hypothetical protein [Polyangiaceae bacterium]
MSRLTGVTTNAGTSPSGAAPPGGHEGRVLRTDGAAVAIQSTLPSPPGSLVTFLLEGTAATYKMKVRGCRKSEGADLPFTIEGRFVDLTRAQRDAILRAAASGD